MTAHEQWKAEQLAKAPALTEAQQRTLRRIMVPAQPKRRTA